MTTEEKLATMQAELDKLKGKSKDAWDIFQIVAGLLIPASITMAGYLYANSMKEAEIQSSDIQAARQAAIANTNARVGQAGVVSSFLDALLSENAQRRKLAVAAVLIALPDDGPNLVKVLSESDADPSVKTFAGQSLDKRRTTLVNQLYSDNPTERTSAADQLTRSWKGDPRLVDDLVATAQKNPKNANGVYNSTVVMQGVDPEVVKTRADVVRSFLQVASDNGEKTKVQADRLRALLARQSP
jgi:hypothetical protein